jgi:hypothetical protein
MATPTSGAVPVTRSELRTRTALVLEVAVTGANEGPVTILDLLEIVGPLPKGTTRERLAKQDATVVETQAIEVPTETKPILPDDVALAAKYFNK